MVVPLCDLHLLSTFLPGSSSGISSKLVVLCSRPYFLKGALPVSHVGSSASFYSDVLSPWNKFIVAIPFSSFNTGSLVSTHTGSVLSTAPTQVTFSFTISEIYLFVSGPCTLGSLSMVVSLSTFSHSLSRVSCKVGKGHSRTG